MTFKAYAALGVLALIAGLFSWAMWLRGDLATAKANLATTEQSLKIAVAVSKEKDNTIRTLGDRAAITEDVLRGVAEDIRKINETTAATNQAVDDLGEANPDVKSFLNTPLPPELDRLLNKTP